MTSDFHPPLPYAGDSAQLALAAPRTYQWSQHLARDVHQVLQRLLGPQQTSRWWDGASVFLAIPGDITVASAVNSSVTSADEVQLRLDQGPALDTLLLGQDLMVEDTAAEQRWPDWARVMARAGWRSIATRSVGSPAAGAALCIYARAPGAFTLEAGAAADSFAQQARTAVFAALEVLSSSEELANPVERDPDVITRAIGRVMDHYRADQYDAFELLCGLAQTSHSDLHVAAASIMSGRHGLA